MIKPASFEQLPYSIKESFLWNCDLDFDGYESSKAEEVHNILCNYPYDGSTNDLIIKSAYNMLSVESLEHMVRGHLDGLKHQVTELENLLNT